MALFALARESVCEADHDLAVGDLVRLKSGGVWMTVTGWDVSDDDEAEPHVRCSWFAADKLFRSSLPLAALFVKFGGDRDRKAETGQTG